VGRGGKGATFARAPGKLSNQRWSSEKRGMGNREKVEHRRQLGAFDEVTGPEVAPWGTKKDDERNGTGPPRDVAGKAGEKRVAEGRGQNPAEQSVTHLNRLGNSDGARSS